MMFRRTDRDQSIGRAKMNSPETDSIIAVYACYRLGRHREHVKSIKVTIQ